MFRYPPTTVGSWCPPTTTTVRSAAMGGNAAPLPSKSTRSGARPTATRAPSPTFEDPTAPASPPPHRRQPTVGDTDESGGLEMIRCGMSPRSRERDERRRSSEARSRPRARAALLSPSRQRRRVGRQREAAQRARSRRSCRRAYPSPRRRSTGARRARATADRDGSPLRRTAAAARGPGSRARSARRGRARARRRGRRPRPERARRLRTRRRRRAERRTPLPRAASLTPDQNGRDELVRQLGERVTHDGGVVLAVDDRESPHVRAVTSSSIAPVNFAYSRVSRANETSFTWPWNG